MTVLQAAQLLLQKDNILIVTHKNPDGDTLCSSSALCRALNRCGKTAYLYRNPQISEKYMRFVGHYLAPDGFTPDYYCSVDVAAEDMFARGFSGKINMCIDHHPSNIGFGEENCIYPHCAACGEIVTRIIENMPCSIDDITATLLYIAVTTDCGAFMYSNTKADTFDCCGRLVRCGANLPLVNSVFFRKVSKSRLALEGLILSNLEYYEDGKIVIAQITNEMMKKTGATENDTDDLAGIPGRADTENIGITIRETDNNRCKVSVRTIPGISARDMCEKYGGGGHDMAGGCTIEGDITLVKEMILETSIEALHNS